MQGHLDPEFFDLPQEDSSISNKHLHARIIKAQWIQPWQGILTAGTMGCVCVLQ